ncbi:MAG TPA: hypothetical protein VGG64_25770 [Pirellulales bacterium]
MILEKEGQRADYFHAFDQLLFVRVGLCFHFTPTPPQHPAPGRLLLAYMTPAQPVSAGPTLTRIAYCHVWEDTVDCCDPCNDAHVIVPESFLPNLPGERPAEWLASVVYDTHKNARPYLLPKVRQAWQRQLQHSRKYGYEIARPVASKLMPVFGYAQFGVA